MDQKGMVKNSAIMLEEGTKQRERESDHHKCCVSSRNRNKIQGSAELFEGINTQEFALNDVARELRKKVQYYEVQSSLGKWVMILATIIGISASIFAGVFAGNEFVVRILVTSGAILQCIGGSAGMYYQSIDNKRIEFQYIQMRTKKWLHQKDPITDKNYEWVISEIKRVETNAQYPVSTDKKARNLEPQFLKPTERKSSTI